ncbi:DMT family transporter [Halomonas sp. GFAJ-1]|uniref:DMT family transporter n=1 Tax=Halomonas sp. GFAJ-1 TaxID=1118153 RepID=UPI00023A46C9|nr:EamA family transporter [Halomonas sp. GFAJ-1]AVI62234.1 multidrug DMT transporter permease [Halomonas sp. GFAJ-1]EHK60880.1 DMT superfamily permease [Halomonas sp. GFAJ-1]
MTRHAVLSPSTPSIAPSSLVLAVVAAVGMATIGVISRITELSAESITFYRLGLGAAFLLIYLVLTKRHVSLKALPGRHVVLSGLFLAAFILFYVQAMNYTQMANAILMVYLAPIFAAVVAHTLFAERLTPQQVSFIGLALFGFAMMQEFRLNLEDRQDVIGMGFGLAAMLAYSGFILTNRRLPRHLDDRTCAFWQLLVGALAILPFALWQPDGLTAATWQWPWLLAAGFVPGFLALLCAVMAINRLPTALYGTLAYCEPVAVVIFGWSLFGEALTPLQLAGCSLVLASGIAQAWLGGRAATPSTTTG